MKVNVEFLIVAYLFCQFVDWVFQSQWQTNNKSRWNKADNKELSGWALLSHSIIYAALSSIFFYLVLGIAPVKILIIFWTLLVTHAIIDSRIPVKWIMRAKGLTDSQIQDYVAYGFMHIGIDHRLHELVLLILAFVV